MAPLRTIVESERLSSPCPLSRGRARRACDTLPCGPLGHSALVRPPRLFTSLPAPVPPFLGSPVPSLLNARHRGSLAPSTLGLRGATTFEMAELVRRRNAKLVAFPRQLCHVATAAEWRIFVARKRNPLAAARRVSHPRVTSAPPERFPAGRAVPSAPRAQRFRARFRCASSLKKGCAATHRAQAAPLSRRCREDRDDLMSTTTSGSRPFSDRGVTRCKSAPLGTVWCAVTSERGLAV